MCSFKCSSTSVDVVDKCFKPGTSTIRDRPIESFNINPYEEFDLVVATLRKDRANPYPLSYAFKECDNVCNAASVMIDSLRFIYYNQNFLNTLSSSSDQLRWIVRCIIAHEIGHHLLEHTLPKRNNLYQQDRRRQELHADYFAAFVIKQFPGSTIENALAGIRSLNRTDYIPRNAAEEQINDYPTLDNREAAIREGFNHDDNNPLRIAMFQRLDSVALATALRYGSSVILRQIDRDISFNNYREALQKIEQLKKSPLSNEEKAKIQKLENFVTEQTKKFDRHSIDPPAPTIKNDDIQVLKDLYEQLKKSKKTEDKVRAESLLKMIKELESMQEI